MLLKLQQQIRKTSLFLVKAPRNPPEWTFLQHPADTVKPKPFNSGQAMRGEHFPEDVFNTSDDSWVRKTLSHPH